MSLVEVLRRPALQLMDQVQLPLAIVDAADRVTYVNRASCNAVGVTRERLLGLCVEDHISEDERPHYREHLLATRRDGAGIVRTWLELPERDALPIVAVAGSLAAPGGAWLGCVVAMLPHDVAEVEMAARIVRAGTLARAVLHAVTEELEAGAAETTAAELSRLEQVPELARLTPRERAVARRLAAGQRTSVIAKQLGITQNTVRNHLKAIFRKTGASRQLELVARIKRWQDGRNEPL